MLKVHLLQELGHLAEAGRGAPHRNPALLLHRRRRRLPLVRRPGRLIRGTLPSVEDPIDL